MTSQKNIKITCIIHSLSLGGMERVMSLLLNDFSKRDNVEVSLLLIGRDREVQFDIDSRVTIYTPDFAFNPQKRTISTLKTMRFIRQTVATIQPDRILSFGEFWNNLVLLSLYGASYPVFIADRSKPNINLGRFHNRLRQRLYPNATGFIVQTEKAKDLAEQHKRNKNIAVIGNPIRQIAACSGVAKENIVLTVGRLIPTKHIDQLIRIFIDADVPDWKLVIVGGNAKKMQLLETYRQDIVEKGWQNRIELVGAQKDVDAYYRKSKLFAFTSSSEGFPNVVGEALAAALPVVSYDCVAGPSEMIIDGENGFLIPLFDEKQFREKLSLLMRDADLRTKMTKNTTQSIKKFESGYIADQFFEFITT